MNFDLSDEQKMLAEQAAGLLAERSSPDRLRTLIDAAAEWDEDLWRELGALGFLGVCISEEYGGLGMSALDMGVISQELGRTVACTPFFSSIVMCATAIELCGDTEQKAKWLPLIASGEIVGTFAHAEGPDAIARRRMHFEDGALDGTKRPVADAGIATIAVVSIPNGLVLVELDQPGVRRTRLHSFDALRPHYSLDFVGAKGKLMAGKGSFPDLLDRAAVQSGFEAVGGSEACLSMAVSYAGERRIFARPLASYQAIKHTLADIATDIEIARSNAFFAGWAADNRPEELPVAAASLRLSAMKAFAGAARENLQIHGGIGYTFEGNCHFHYNRERLLAVNVGDERYWARRLIESTRRLSAHGGRDGLQ